MAQKFKQGDVVISERGSIVLVTISLAEKPKIFSGVIIEPGETDHRDKGYYSDTWAEYYFTIHPHIITLHPIEPKHVLTEWQRNELISCPWMKNKFIMDDIERILSEPEPPKYQPNENEPVLASDGGCLWAGVFIGMRGDKYVCAIGGFKNAYDKVFPFNSDLVGKVTD